VPDPVTPGAIINTTCSRVAASVVRAVEKAVAFSAKVADGICSAGINIVSPIFALVLIVCRSRWFVLPLSAGGPGRVPLFSDNTFQETVTFGNGER